MQQQQFDVYGKKNLWSNGNFLLYSHFEILKK